MEQQENAEMIPHEQGLVQEQLVNDNGGYYDYVEADESADIKEPIYMDSTGAVVAEGGHVEMDEAAVVEQGGYMDADGNFIPAADVYYEGEEAIVDEHGQLVQKSEYPVQYVQQTRRSQAHGRTPQYASGSGYQGPSRGTYGFQQMSYSGAGTYQPSPRRQMYQAPPVATPSAVGAHYGASSYGVTPRSVGQRYPMEYRQPPMATRHYPGSSMDPNYKNYYEQDMEMKHMSTRPLGNISNTPLAGAAAPPLVSTMGFPRSALAAAAPNSYTGGSILTSFLGTSKAANKIRKASSKKKPCNCTKSMCLKLYCDCFANGEFCLDCNCRECHNNLEHENERSKAIKSSLERNPTAFKPKIGVSAKVGKSVDMERLHQKGCHCKKSNCLKNYCECYEAKVPCTDRCKCCSCRNTEHDRHHKYKDKFSTTAGGLAQLAAAAAADARSTSPFSDDDDDACGGANDAPNPKTQPWFYLTEDVTETITMCLVAHALELENSNVPDEALEQGILGEFGRCLDQIIENAKYCQQTIHD